MTLKQLQIARIVVAGLLLGFCVLIILAAVSFGKGLMSVGASTSDYVSALLWPGLIPFVAVCAIAFVKFRSEAAAKVAITLGCGVFVLVVGFLFLPALAVA